jgi:hypothetical protein
MQNEKLIKVLKKALNRLEIVGFFEIFGVLIQEFVHFLFKKLEFDTGGC